MQSTLKLLRNSTAPLDSWYPRRQYRESINAEWPHELKYVAVLGHRRDGIRFRREGEIIGYSTKEGGPIYRLEPGERLPGGALIWWYADGRIYDSVLAALGEGKSHTFTGWERHTAKEGWPASLMNT